MQPELCHLPLSPGNPLAGRFLPSPMAPLEFAPAAVLRLVSGLPWPLSDCRESVPERPGIVVADGLQGLWRQGELGKSADVALR
jgi:hypothetical protein